MDVAVGHLRPPLVAAVLQRFAHARDEGGGVCGIELRAKMTRDDVRGTAVCATVDVERQLEIHVAESVHFSDWFFARQWRRPLSGAV
jgi:hypothetical protein